MRVIDRKTVSKVSDPDVPGAYMPLVDVAWWPDGNPWFQVAEERTGEYVIDIIDN